MELESATEALHLDIYNVEYQLLVNSLRGKMRGIEKRNAKGAVTRVKTKWKHVGDKCFRQNFQAVQKKNTNLAILGVKNK